MAVSVHVILVLLGVLGLGIRRWLHQGSGITLALAGPGTDCVRVCCSAIRVVDSAVHRAAKSITSHRPRVVARASSPICAEYVRPAISRDVGKSQRDRQNHNEVRPRDRALVTFARN